MGFLDNVGGFFKDAGNGIAHAAGDGYKAASDAWNTVFEDAKASANVVGTAVRDADAKKEQIGYDPSAFGKKLEADVTTAEKALLLEDRNVGTSLVNTAIATTATVARGFLSILQVGTGAAQGVEDIRRGFSESGDAWDVAIGASRLLSDAGEIASASLTVAGAATKVAQTSKVMILDREIEIAQAQRSAAGVSQTTKVNLSEKLGELNAEKAFTQAGYQKPGLTGDLKRIPANGGNVRQGIDQGYRSLKPFAGTDAVVEAKGLARPPSNAADALKTDVRGLVEGSANWNIDRLRSAANSGNVNAQKMLARLAGDAPVF